MSDERPGDTSAGEIWPPPQDQELFTAARIERRQRVIRAILDFAWDNYGLDAVTPVIEAGRRDPSCNAWAEDLADDVLAGMKSPPRLRT